MLKLSSEMGRMNADIAGNLFKSKRARAMFTQMFLRAAEPPRRLSLAEFSGANGVRQNSTDLRFDDQIGEMVSLS
jgi:hypothetical protein